jgi:DNA adenine methylase
MSNCTHYSPLRYPGGKTILSDFIGNLIIANNLEGSKYFEPYSGGAGVALNLLFNGLVDEIYLNDADLNIYALWYSILNNKSKMVDKILNTDISIAEWHKQKSILNDSQNKLFDIGFATFFINRCSRSGIIKNSGPIGGFEQTGKWKINARFNKLSLVEKIEKIARFKDRITLNNDDAIVFLKSYSKKFNKKRSLAYLDPPYYNNGETLYMNYYSHDDHIELSNFINSQYKDSWFITYDNHDVIKKIYDKHNIFEYQLNYSVQRKRKEKELFILPEHIFIPKNLQILKQPINFN